MAYTIKFQPVNRIRGVTESATTIETAGEAWETVQRLQASDERVRILDSSGHEIDWTQLRDIAARGG